MLSVTHRLNRGGYDELVTVCIDCVSDDPGLRQFAHKGRPRGASRPARRRALRAPRPRLARTLPGNRLMTAQNALYALPGAPRPEHSPDQEIAAHANVAGRAHARIRAP